MAAHKLPVALFLLLTLSLLPQAQGLTSTTLTLAVSPAPSVLGAPVTLSATATPSNATGKITFYDGVTVLGTKTLSGGSASFLTGLLPSGPRKLRAYYVGDSGNAAATSNMVTQTVKAQASVGFAVGGGYSAVSYTVTGDFNGDGIADFAIISEFLAGLTVLLGNGDGTFQSVTTSSFPLSAPVAVADFNSDGKADLLVWGPDSEGLYFMAGNGDGTFQAGIPIISRFFYSGTWVADFNGDGKPDLAVSTQDGVYILLGKGDGTFQPGAQYAPGSSVALAVGDFNGDGNADLAIGAGKTFSILLGVGDGTFQAPLNGPAGTSGGNFVVADFNQDGKADLASLSSDTVLIRLGNGDGTFRPSMSFPTGLTGATSLAVGDFNGDGNVDLAISTVLSGGSWSILQGNGDGTFRPPVSSSTGFEFSTVLIAGDFNGDGKTDLFINGTVLLGTTLSLAATGGTPQSTVVGTAFPIPLQATLRDGSNPVSGASVTFGAYGGATLSSTTATTDSS